MNKVTEKKNAIPQNIKKNLHFKRNLLFFMTFSHFIYLFIEENIAFFFQFF